MNAAQFVTPLRIGGVFLLIAGLQAWGFNYQTRPLLADAHKQLTTLQQELPDNRLMNESLLGLQDYWRLADRESSKTKALALRDTVLQQFGAKPVAAVQEFARVVGEFEAQSSAQQSALASLQSNVAALESAYTDHYDRAIMAVSYPAWYLQPTASLLNNNRSLNQKLEFNHALYLSHVGDTTAAVEVLDILRRDSNEVSNDLASRVSFVMSRVQFQAFQAEPDPAFFRDAVQHAQQSVNSDANYALPKVFLEYLLSIDRKSAAVDTSPLEGQGEGEGEGERGAIATDRGEF
jgi:hypothetical protein